MIYKFTQIVEEILSTNSTIDEPAAISNVNDPSTSSADNPSIADDLSRVEDLSWIEGTSCFDQRSSSPVENVSSPLLLVSTSTGLIPMEIESDTG